ncbi:hypothetical protein HPB50_027755 [Hyalomma asiaticum]|nr:hypothetical protein HPB50_027755 [Hyalomma asiaticum]
MEEIKYVDTEEQFGMVASSSGSEPFYSCGIFGLPEGSELSFELRSFEFRFPSVATLATRSPRAPADGVTGGRSEELLPAEPVEDMIQCCSMLTSTATTWRDRGVHGSST